MERPVASSVGRGTLGFLALVLAALSALATAGCSRESPTSASDGGDPSGEASFAGSRSCRECHERFYELWAPSHHGTAMQPFSPEFARNELAPQPEGLTIGDITYRYRSDDEGGHIHEVGPAGERRHPIAQVMGGKNVYFFLTPHERGRLQVLPLAFDVDERAWYDATASMVRHAVQDDDEPVAWTDPLLTFNTSCWNCHVSQLSVNYDASDDSYESRWAEPGINCETCHGPAEAHIRACRDAPEGQAPEDLEIIVVRDFSAEQVNSTCASCHAKASPLGDEFAPGDRFFDHFDLVTLEHTDFYPDGRDLGENYTMTSWRMSPCARVGGLDCVDCHTSSGRYRFAGESPNDACLPCHEQRVSNSAEHSRHEPGSPGDRCVACHMPMTEFARMKRSDHSMRPPAPSLTLEHGSPNACNICHEDRDASWADRVVRDWRERDYQAPLLATARLVAQARELDWSRLDEMLAYLADDDRDEIVATSLIRLLRSCGDPRTVPAFREALADRSPLVRSAAAAALEGHVDPESFAALIELTGDEFRLVRVRAAGALADVPLDRLRPEDRERLEPALAELERSLATRPDAWYSHYNLANFYERRGDPARALAEYDVAARLRPDAAAPLVNAAMVHARAGRPDLAEPLLTRALDLEPDSAEVHFNLGLLRAEQGEVEAARRHLLAAVGSDPPVAGAAYNLAVLTSRDDPASAAGWARIAHELEPTDARFAWTYAFYLNESGEAPAAARVLERVAGEGHGSAEIYGLLVRIRQARGETEAARDACLRAARDANLPRDVQAEFARMAESLR